MRADSAKSLLEKPMEKPVLTKSFGIQRSKPKLIKPQATAAIVSNHPRAIFKLCHREALRLRSPGPNVWMRPHINAPKSLHRRDSPPSFRQMRTLSVLLALALLTRPASALMQYTSEDISRFRSKDYPKAEPGMLKPSEYVARANKVLHERYPGFDYTKIKLGGVTHRFYTDAPKRDRDIICVTFIYQQLVPAHLEGGGTLAPAKTGLIPGILVLIRKDLSKIYVNGVYYQYQ